jgi:hypothetical protein
MELRNNHWINAIQNRITTATQIQEFVSLWIRTQDTHLTPVTRDCILWRWTADVTYSARSAYCVQFRGSFELFWSSLIWRAQAKNKCKVFACSHGQWHWKKFSLRTIYKKGSWPHQDHCVVCNGPLETCIYFALLCPFTKSVWRLTLSWGISTKI